MQTVQNASPSVPILALIGFFRVATDGLAFTEESSMSLPKGYKHSEETKCKISNALLGKLKSKIHKENIRKARLGTQCSEEVRHQISIKMINNKNHLGCHHTKETLLKISGKRSTHWRGGKSFEPYSFEFNKLLKREIRERDNYTCEICGKHNSRCIHHINYDKKDNRTTNLIILCRSCHTIVNRNRDFWCGYLFLLRILSA